MLVEVQGTGEESTYSRAQMDELMDMAEKGLQELYAIQKDAIGNRTTVM
jgi:ribonuclease PH